MEADETTRFDRVPDGRQVPSGRVSPQIADAVTAANVKVVADAPAMSLGTVYETLAASTGLVFGNAVSGQQQTTAAAQASTAQGVIQLYGIPLAVDALATSKLASADVPELIMQLRTALAAVDDPSSPSPSPTGHYGDPTSFDFRGEVTSLRMEPRDGAPQLHALTVRGEHRGDAVVETYVGLIVDFDLDLEARRLRGNFRPHRP